MGGDIALWQNNNLSKWRYVLKSRYLHFLLTTLDMVVSVTTLILPACICIILLVSYYLTILFNESKEENMKDSKGVSCIDVGTWLFVVIYYVWFCIDLQLEWKSSCLHQILIKSTL